MDHKHGVYAKDFSEYFTASAKARLESPLKGLLKYALTPGMTSFGGGLPHPSTFPFERVQVDMKAGTAGAHHVAQVDVGLHKKSPDSACLNTGLQYAGGRGQEPIRSYCEDISRRVHAPQYDDWDVVLSVGNTDSFEKSCQMFLNRGDTLLLDEWTYPSVLETLVPMGIDMIGIPLDEEGMSLQALATELDEWSERHPTQPRPRVIYLVPTGQNPTGATMSLERRQAIYRICQSHDVIIIEDDPYYALQLTPYQPPDTRQSSSASPTPIPTFLSLDTDGRVIRLDSFSKVIAPAVRLGWVTASKQIIQRLAWHQEVTCQMPSGFSQVILAELFSERGWGVQGWNDHVQAVRREYEARRDMFLDCCSRYLDQRFVSYIEPMGGMFVWMHFPHLVTEASGGDGVTAKQLFERLIENNVLLVPGHMFSAAHFGDWDYAPYFRASFAYAGMDEIEGGLQRMGAVLTELFDRSASR